MKHAQPKSHTACDSARYADAGARAASQAAQQLDALCKRYEVDASKRDVHGALIDSELLARVYLAMTGGQTALSARRQMSPTSGTRGGQATNMPANAGRAARPRRRQGQRRRSRRSRGRCSKKLRKSGACVWDDAAQGGRDARGPRRFGAKARVSMLFPKQQTV